MIDINNIELRDIISIISFIIAAIALWYNVRNSKRQIRINKIEEIAELISFLESYYSALHRISNEALKVNSISLPQKNELLKDYEESVKSLREFITPLEFITKSSRIEILSNGYLPSGELKLTILSALDMFGRMTTLAFTRNSDSSIKSFPEGFPSDKVFKKIVDEIQRKLIKQMKLGNTYTEWPTLRLYIENEFKKKIKKFS